jgi:hypothetical protein
VRCQQYRGNPWWTGGSRIFSKVYWNKDTQVVYVDAAECQNLPKNGVSGLGSKIKSLTPTSIGLLDKFDDNNQRIFAVNNTGDAEAFAITLEPAGGSLNPTMEQLYTLGRCNLLKNILLLKRLSRSLFFCYTGDYSFKLFIPVFAPKHSI